MSRRTKLIITAIFLVLLSIPAIHLARIWHPKNPLRFQLAEHAEGWESDPPSVGTYTTIYIKVTNTSAASIYLDTAELMSDDTPPGENPSMGYLHLMLPKDLESHVKAGGELMIPPHGTLYADCRVHPQHMPALRATHRTGATVSSIWDTSSRLSFESACHWLRRHLPEAMRPTGREMSLRLNRSPLAPYSMDAPAETRSASP
jgi:hypothetical protein